MQAEIRAKKRALATNENEEGLKISETVHENDTKTAMFNKKIKTADESL